MLFITSVDDEAYVFQLPSLISNEEQFVEINGYPVEPYIVHLGNPNLNDGFVISGPENIGWFDEGDHSDELSDIEPKHYNIILNDFGGRVDVEVDEEGELILYANKITIRCAQEEQIEDYE